MANYANLKAQIDANIFQNDSQAITGAIMNAQLKAMVDALGAGYQFMGVATPTTDPGTPDQRVFYIAATSGAYPNFGSLTVNNGEVAILRYDTSWAKLTTGIAPALVGSQFMGYAVPTTDPGTVNQKVHFVASAPGTYTNFGGIAVSASDGMVFLSYNGTQWTKIVPYVPTSEQVESVEQRTSNLEASVNGGTKITPVSLDLQAGYWDTHKDSSYVQIGDTFNKTSRSSSTTTYSAKVAVSAGQTFRVKGAGSRFMGLYVLTNSSNVIVDEVINYASSSPAITISVAQSGYLYVNLANYDSDTDFAVELVETTVNGLVNDVPELAEMVKAIEDTLQYDLLVAAGKTIIGDGTAKRAVVFEDITDDTLAGKVASCYYGGFESSVPPPSNPYMFISFFDISGSLISYKNIYAGARQSVPIPTGTHRVYIYGSISASSSDLTTVGATYTFTGIDFHIEQTVDARLDLLEKEITALDIRIPDKVYAVVGTEMNLYNDSVSISPAGGLAAPVNYHIVWICNKGKITSRGFRFTPQAADIGEHSCTCILYNANWAELKRKTFIIKVLSKSAISSAKNIIYFGDSLGSAVAGYLFENFKSERYAGTIPTMLGSRQDSSHYSGVVHYEGAGGYRWQEFATEGRAAYRVDVSGVGSVGLDAVYSITISGTTTNLNVREVNLTGGTGNILLEHPNGSVVAGFPSSGTLTKVSGSGDASIVFTNGTQEPNNPLWHDGALDIEYYKTNWLGLQSTDKIDAVIFQLGLNDRSLANDPDTLLGYIQSLYAAFIGNNAACKFIIGLTTTSCSMEDGAGENFGASLDIFEYHKLIDGVKKIYLSLQGNNNYPRLFFSTPNLYLDRYYGFNFAERQISQRDTDTEMANTNYSHPNNPVGWGQMADAQMAAIIAALS